ncbi:N-acetylmannosamine-6-phosphate 2-epimerase [Diplocloster hominis]|uniref:N-acetylmannosamine-6-phosphate 2-epimerase n=1 Tax=Diplocloster hominis TaxID=3079010 RepID=UPI0031BA1387
MKAEELKKGLIVSCQATSEEPMRESSIIGRFALAAEMGGAVGVRINGISDILATKQIVKIPVIGLVKHTYPGYWSYITPTLRDVESVYVTGAEIIAVDATRLPKPEGKDVRQLLREIKKEFPDVLLLADVSTLEEGLAAIEEGSDLISTTLAGYTEYTRNYEDPRIIELQDPDVQLVRELAQRVKVPVIAEGRYWDDTLAIQAFEAGAHNVVIGAGITRPQIITKKIVDNIQAYL